VGELAFTVHQPSTGSTAPAWTALLALGYVLDVSPTYWAYLWGTVFAIAAAVLAALLSYRYFGRSEAMFLVAIVCVIEWHMAWASLSGMEITLFTFLSLFFFYLLDRDAHLVWLGFVAGVSFLVRPEALLLVVLYGLRLLHDGKTQNIECS
jgi:Gpi18-like mannosyltransferase